MPGQIKPELLSPAGSMDALWAAINNGADAVYLGASSFGARSTAGFDSDKLKEAVRVAHFFQKRVYITMNTLIKEREFESFLLALEDVVSSGADAILVQDLGALRLIKEKHPHVPVHASTQMTIHHLTGAKYAVHMGIDRVVFARETPLSVLKSTAATGIEVEAFVHGALCVSVSGQCTLSSMIGGRSGNRGRCAQPCRMGYVYRDKQGAWLSPRDISMADHVPALIDAGIASLKIEGRLKRPEYVAVVTKIYRNLIDQSDMPDSIRESYRTDLLQIFNRGGFSKGYVFGDQDAAIMNPLHVSHEGIPIGVVMACRPMGDKYLATIRLTLPLHDQDGLEIRGQTNQGMIYSGKDAAASSMVDIRLHQPAMPQSLVYRLDSAQQLNAAQKSVGTKGATPVPLEAALHLEPGKPALLTLSDGTTNVTTQGVVTKEAQRAPLSAENTDKAITKAGDFPVLFTAYSFNSTSPSFLPVSALNQLRRDGLEAFYQARVNDFQKLHAKSKYHVATKQENKDCSLEIILQSADIQHLDLFKSLGIGSFFYAPVEFKKEDLANALRRLGEKDALVLPRQTNDETLAMLNSLVHENPVNVVLNNIGQMGLHWPRGVIAGNGIHTWNNASLQLLKEQGFVAATLSRELAYTEQADLSRSILPLIQNVYGRNALMVLNHCPERVYRGLSKGHIGCTLCHQQEGTRGQSLQDRMGASFPLYPLHLPEGCINYLLDEKPLHIGEKATMHDAWLLHMTIESSEEIQEIIRYYVALRRGEDISSLHIPYYHGRYQKGVD